MLSLATGLAATVFIPSTQALIAAFGWRPALQVLACLNVLCAAAYAVSVPGYRALPRSTEVSAGSPGGRAPLYRRALEGRFWALVVAAVAKAAISTSLAVHLLPLLVERGFSSAAALAVLALAGPVTVGTRILLLVCRAGWAGSGRSLGVVAVLAQLLAQITLVAVGPAWVGLLALFTIFNGVAEGLFTIALPLVTAELWGDAGYATIQGAIQTLSLLSRAVAPALIAAIWGLQGNYRLAGALLALAAAVSAAAYILAVVPWRSRNLFDTKKHRHAKASTLRWFGRAGP
jgi:hypothetical protein